MTNLILLEEMKINESAFKCSSASRWYGPYSAVSKNLSNIRREANAKTTEAILENYCGITDVLSNIHDNKEENKDSREEARNILQKI